MTSSVNVLVGVGIQRLRFFTIILFVSAVRDFFYGSGAPTLLWISEPWHSCSLTYDTNHQLIWILIQPNQQWVVDR